MISRALAVLAALPIAACVQSPPDAVSLSGAPGGMKFVRLVAGSFQMGSPPAEKGREPQELRHHVRLTRPFYLATTEVTKGQWFEVMQTNPSHFADCGAHCPVERVNYQEILVFLDRLNARAGGGYRLPTEAEWEYACRAGGDAPFGHVGRLDASLANIDGRYPYDAPVSTGAGATLKVGTFQPNAWGLFDMSGNVWEWTSDDHCPYPSLAVTDPVGTCGSDHKVIRGGSWAFDGNSARCALRYTHRPQDRGFSLGFRLARAAN
jgi:formylglycine-generating enzyme required for sulfatase activity